MSANPIKLKCIDELLSEDFFVPDFQRGYRWSTEQVKTLLDDIWKFRDDSQSAGKSAFYCLQPLVVAKGEKGWTLIDGQQRLTTIRLILSHLKLYMDDGGKSSFTFKYQTRPESEEFLNHPTEEKSRVCPDYFHIYEAYKTIEQWFLSKGGTAKSNFFNTLLNTDEQGKNVKVIWYEVPLQSANEHINIFTRLNIGKIPLKNAELIKALLLQKGNFSKESASLRQIQIATEWDIIEQKLQQPDFWHFIYEEKGLGPYENRIEFIFDLMYERKREHEQYHTFFKFNEDATNTKDRSGKVDIGSLWLKVKQYFQAFEEWYADRYCYHMVGFLVTCGESITDLRKASLIQNKDQFKAHLKSRIKHYMNFNVRNLEYNNNSSEKDRIRRTLLLFNIQTLMTNKEADTRFPFYNYKTLNWDIEHIRSQTEKDIKSNTQRQEWLGDVFNYFTGRELNDWKGRSPQEMENILQLKNIALAFCQQILDLAKMEIIDQINFNELRKDLEVHFGERTSDGDLDFELTDSIGNLALLNDYINRSYKNAMFTIKRKKIIEHDQRGKFLPICTKNVFLKYYSNRFDNPMHWSTDDAKAYEQAIYDTLEAFLKA